MSSRRQFLRATGATGLLIAFDLPGLSALSVDAPSIAMLAPNASPRTGSDHLVAPGVPPPRTVQAVRTPLPSIPRTHHRAGTPPGNGSG